MSKEQEEKREYKNYKGYADEIKKIKKDKSFQNVIYHYVYGKYNFEGRKVKENDLDYKDKIGQNISSKNEDFENEINKIALWKLNRFIVFEDPVEAKGKLEALMEMSNECINEEIKIIAGGNFKKESNKLYKTMEYFLNEKKVQGIRLAMLSTIFRFYNPEVFPIIDVRAYRSSWVLYFGDHQHDDEFKELYSDRKDGKNLEEDERLLKPMRISSNNHNRIVEYCRYIQRCRCIMQELYSVEPNMAEMDEYLYKIDKDTDYTIDQSLIN